ncbi:MAG: YHYH protein [Pseudomonadota bacterium]
MRNQRLIWPILVLMALFACQSGGGEASSDATVAAAPVVTTNTTTTDPTPLQDGVDYTKTADYSGRTNWACDNDSIVDAVTGQVLEPDVAMTTNMAALVRQFLSNSIPDHRVGDFPNNANPNTIGEVAVSYDLVLRVEGEQPDLRTATTVPHAAISLGGILFDPNTAEFYNNDRNSGWNYEALTVGAANNSDLSGAIGYLGTDCNNAHVQPTGKYHYHGMPEALVDDFLQAAGHSTNNPAMVLLGFAADGYPVYARYGYVDAMDPNSGITVMRGSYELKSGTRPSGPGGSYDGTFVQDWTFDAETGDLDACNGRYGVTPEYPGGIYHYFVTDDYPFVQRCVWGEPTVDAFNAGP